jgi:hypothetical protein
LSGNGRAMLIYPEGQIVLTNGRATEIPEALSVPLTSAASGPQSLPQQDSSVKIAEMETLTQFSEFLKTKLVSTTLGSKKGALNFANSVTWNVGDDANDKFPEESKASAVLLVAVTEKSFTIQLNSTQLTIEMVRHPIDAKFQAALQKVREAGYVSSTEADAIIRNLLKMDDKQQSQYEQEIEHELVDRITKQENENAQIAAQQQKQQQAQQAARQQAAYQQSILSLSYAQLLMQQQQQQQFQSWQAQQQFQQQQQQFQNFVNRTTPQNYMINNMPVTITGPFP